VSDEKKTSRHYTPAGVVEFTYNHSDFICTCSEDGKAEAEALMNEVCERLKCNRENMLSAVVFSLVWDYEAAITGLHADQWAGVSAEGKDLSTFIQCDHVEHGVAATWKAFADHTSKEASDDHQTS
jgi:hypothetical protein